MARWHLTSRNGTRKVRGLTVGLIGLAVAVTATGGATAASIANATFGHEQVGNEDAQGKLLPDNQRITPLGQRTLITNGRLLSSNLSPDGKHLAALSWEDFAGFLTIFDVTNGKVIQQLGTGVGADAALGDTTVAADGPFYSPDGKSLWFPQTEDLLRFSVNPDGSVAPKPVASIALVDAIGPYLPSGMAFSADGKTAFVALNGANTLGVIDTTTNTLTKQIPVGIAPRQVAWAHNKLFVSNEGGRPAMAGDVTNLSDNTPVVSDPSTGAGVSGTVSVVDPVALKQTATITVGLQPTALKVSGSTVFVANSNADSVSVINAANNAVTQTFNVAPLPGSTVGSNPNAIEVTAGNRILVSIGRDNALAVYYYSGPTVPVKYLGPRCRPTSTLSTSIYDKAIGQDCRHQRQGHRRAWAVRATDHQGPDGPKSRRPATTPTATPGPSPSLRRRQPGPSWQAFDTKQVFVNNDWEKLLANGPRRMRQQATRGGRRRHSRSTSATPPPIKHVFLIVKENRTYDQVLGDIGKGNSDPSLTQFGASR